MSAVWELADLSQSETLVLLALADHANDDGLCWPSIAGLAQKARLERRATQYVMKRLEKRGLLQISRGTGKGHTSRYRLNLKGAENAPFQNKGCNQTTQRVHLEALKGATAIAPESSLTIKNLQEEAFYTPQITPKIGDLGNAVLAKLKRNAKRSA